MSSQKRLQKHNTQAKYSKEEEEDLWEYFLSVL